MGPIQRPVRAVRLTQDARGLSYSASVAQTPPSAEPWYVDDQLVVAFRVDASGLVLDATAGLCELLGVPRSSVTGLALAELCEAYFAGSITADDIARLTPDTDKGAEAELIDAHGNLRQVHLACSGRADETRAVLVTDRTELTSTHDHLIRRMAHDRLLHVLVSDLLDASLRDADRVIDDVLAGLVEYFDLVAATLTTPNEGGQQVIARSLRDGYEAEAFRRLCNELPLLEPYDIDDLVDLPGPGDVWHVALDTDDRYAIGLRHRAVTAVEITIPDGHTELSFIATLPGRQFPPKADLELIHSALSHIAQYLRRAAAEEEIRRHSAVDEALAAASAELLSGRWPTVIAALAGPAERIAAVTGCRSFDFVAEEALSPEVRADLEGWHAPKPVADVLLDRKPSDSTTWAAPISDGHRTVALLTYRIDDPKRAEHAAQAWTRLITLVPATAARLDTERRLEAAFQNAPIGISLRDADQRYVDCNDSFLRFLGLERDETVVGRAIAEVIDHGVCDPETSDRLAAGQLNGLELPFRHRSGRVVWGRVSTTQVRHDSSSMSLDHIEDITAARAAQAELDTQRNRDALTGLPSRAAMERELTRRLEATEAVTVTMVDLDRFHSLNSSLGHVAADQLLQQVASRLEATVGPDADLARIGGDEFLIVAPIASHQLGADMAERILSAVRRPFDIDDTPVLITASLGVCVGRGNSSAEDILLGASDALANAKLAGRNRVMHHTSRGDPRRVGQFELALRHAISDEALVVHYQPEFDLNTRLILGAEALVRWPHPTEGLLGAGLFVPLAEEIGLAGELSEFVLREACAAATQWRRDLHPNPFKIRINLSPRDFEQPDIVDRVLGVLESTGLPPGALCLEVTETAFMRDQRTVVRRLHELAALGISLAIDDFGTGFSSLWLLRELPFDTLKIDQSFVAALDSGEIEDRAIVETIVNLGRILGMEITAEGVETQSQLGILRDVGVTRAQGYFFARPESAGQIVDAIARAASPTDPGID